MPVVMRIAAGCFAGLLFAQQRCTMAEDVITASVVVSTGLALLTLSVVMPLVRFI